MSPVKRTRVPQSANNPELRCETRKPNRAVGVTQAPSEPRSRCETHPVALSTAPSTSSSQVPTRSTYRLTSSAGIWSFVFRLNTSAISVSGVPSSICHWPSRPPARPLALLVQHVVPHGFEKGHMPRSRRLLPSATGYDPSATIRNHSHKTFSNRIRQVFGSYEETPQY